MGMLLLNNSDNLHMAAFLKLASRLVPPGHVPPAAGSPGCEDVEDRLPATE